MTAAALALVALYLFGDLGGNVSYLLGRRTVTVATLVLVATAIALASRRCCSTRSPPTASSPRRS